MIKNRFKFFAKKFGPKNEALAKALKEMISKPLKGAEEGNISQYNESQANQVQEKNNIVNGLSSTIKSAK